MSTPLLENILNQPTALQAVANYHLGPGRDALNRASELLRSGKRIVLSGMGASLFACLPLQYALCEMGLPAIAIETAELLYFLPSLVDRDTVVVLVSRSGESVEVTKLLPAIHAKGARILGVVNVSPSTLQAAADETLVLHSPADQMVAIQSYTATVAVLSLLASPSRFDQDIAVLRDSIPAWVAESENWRGFLSDGGPLYLLGRGPALGAVQEGVLLMHETAKSPAIGMSAAQFRHGPVEVTDSRFRGIVLGTQPITRHLDLALAHDLTRMGGQVRWIGPAEEGSSILPLGSWPAGISSAFTPVAEVIPLQIAAYRTAEWRSIRPGEFRWAPLVTTSEADFFTPASQ